MAGQLESVNQGERRHLYIISELTRITETKKTIVCRECILSYIPKKALEQSTDLKVGEEQGKLMASSADKA